MKEYNISPKPGFAIRLLMLVSGIVLAGMGSSCRKFIDVEPPEGLLVNKQVFSDDSSAMAAMTGIFITIMGSSYSFVNTQTTLMMGLSADEFTDLGGSSYQKELYENSLTPNNAYTLILWRDVYKYIYQCNAVIEGLSNSPGISVPAREQIAGEARFFRAFCNFYLVNLFGEIPLAIETDYRINAVSARQSTELVYKQIIADLKESQKLLAGIPITSERIRPDKWAATALLARVYVYTKDWPGAAQQSGELLSNTNYSLVTDLNRVFLKNSREAIWQLAPTANRKYTWEGDTFIVTGSPVMVSVSPELAGNFEPGDLRRVNWLDSIRSANQIYYYPYKYKNGSSAGEAENLMILRLAEQYLIHAESLAHLGNIDGATADLNTIRVRAGLSPLNVNQTTEECFARIAQERRIEFFAEQGHRWLDLKRTGNCTMELSVVKPGWDLHDELYPVPQAERNRNPNLTQNPGY